MDYCGFMTPLKALWGASTLWSQLESPRKPAQDMNVTKPDRLLTSLVAKFDSNTQPQRQSVLESQMMKPCI